MATSRALLSPNEEAALRRIVLGALREDLRQEHLRRLIALELVKTVNDELSVTEAGMNRYRDLPQPSLPKPPIPRRLKSRTLPF
ncbi:MAG: hypothetical protein JOY64_37085 [Alphaproteobacteria bacterium]|nr:hypothetical protein [Alphaproteobacteria bacterium]